MSKPLESQVAATSYNTVCWCSGPRKLFVPMEFSIKIEKERNALKEERDELREEIKSLKETILDQESHILELQARRPFTPGYTAEP